MGFMRDTLRSGRDKAFAAAIRILAEEHVRKYGLLKSLEINSSQGSMEAEILLHGETEPVTFKIDRFEIITTDGEHRIRAYGVSVSRVWIDTLARDFLEGRSIRIPSSAAHALTALL